MEVNFSLTMSIWSCPCTPHDHAHLATKATSNRNNLYLCHKIHPQRSHTLALLWLRTQPSWHCLGTDDAWSNPWNVWGPVQIETLRGWGGRSPQGKYLNRSLNRSREQEGTSQHITQHIEYQECDLMVIFRPFLNKCHLCSPQAHQRDKGCILPLKKFRLPGVPLVNSNNLLTIFGTRHEWKKLGDPPKWKI